MTHKKVTGETGRARVSRLLRETRCECREPAIISFPKNNGSGKYNHHCLTCGGYA